MNRTFQTYSYNPVSTMSTRSQYNLRSIGLPTLFLGALITSYFYVLPLGRFTLASLATDFRIYDFVFALFFITIGLRYLHHFSQLLWPRSSFFYWVILLILVVWLSLTITIATGGFGQLFPAVIRSIRFTAYFLAAGFVLLLVDTPLRYRFMLYVIYFNILIQAVLSVGQSMGWIPNFWPDYWLVGYGIQPVGTLSPHHKQIGVVMLIGIALSLSILRTSRNLFVRFLMLGSISLMLMVVVFAVSRTAWLGLVMLGAGYVFVHRTNAIWISALTVIGILVVFFAIGNTFQDPLLEKVDTVLINRLDRFGVEGVLGDRFKVYDNYPDAILDAPWILLVGTGFQNVGNFLRATGAHNNYAQAWFELGFFGFLIYMRMLWEILSNLYKTYRSTLAGIEKTVAGDAFAAFLGILVTMLVGETLWGQYSMFTLTGQIMTYVALAVTPLYRYNLAQGEFGIKPENAIRSFQR